MTYLKWKWKRKRKASGSRWEVKKEGTWKMSSWLMVIVKVKVNESFSPCLIKQHNMKAHGRVEIQLHTLLTMTLSGGAWSDSCPGHFTPGEIAPTRHSTDGWMGPQTCLNALEWSKMSDSCHKSKTNSSVTWPTDIPAPSLFSQWQGSTCTKLWEHRKVTHHDCPSLGFESSSTGDTTCRPLGPAWHHTVHSCLVSIATTANVESKHIACSLQGRRRSSCYISIFIFFVFCNSNGQSRTHSMNYRNLPNNEHYCVFWQTMYSPDG